MRCLKCGTDIPEGSLYCVECGEDVHIVPDFEPEVEMNIEETIQGIAGEVTIEKKESFQIPTKRNTKKKRKILVVTLVLLGIVFTFFAFYALKKYRSQSVPYQLEQANVAMQETYFDQAIEHYKRVLGLRHNEDNIEVKFQLASAYFLKNDKIEYENVLLDITEDQYASENDLFSAYGKLIAIYRASEDYEKIHAFLIASKNEAIMKKYQDYISLSPEFSIQEGYYTELKPLKLKGHGTGEIYYTMDGSIPNESSIRYTTPIILDDGDYTISACYVNEYGVVSECVTKTFHIKVEMIQAPEVSALSGIYEIPIKIEVLNHSDDVYYTIDGSVPNKQSKRYSEPIQMPLGKTSYKFVRISEGEKSEVVSRTYELTLHTDYTPENALDDVVQYLIDCGKILDRAGHFDETRARFQYEYRYVTSIDSNGDFYVISEVFRDANEYGERTGNHYAVNVYTREISRLQINETNEHLLISLQE